jgi:TRAP-type C4-dicarboxylate transport system permease small subunit
LLTRPAENRTDAEDLALYPLSSDAESRRLCCEHVLDWHPIHFDTWRKVFLMVRTCLDALYRFSGYLAAAFLVAIFLLMLGLSLGREVNLNIPAGDDFAAWCMAALAFLSLAYTFRSGEIIRVGLVIDRFPAGPRRVIELICLVAGSGLTGFFAWYAVLMTYDSYRFNDMSQGVIAVPLWIPQLGYSVGLVILTIAFVDELVHVLRGHAPRYEKPAPATPEEIVERVAEGGI